MRVLIRSSEQPEVGGDLTGVSREATPYFNLVLVNIRENVATM